MHQSVIESEPAVARAPIVAAPSTRTQRRPVLAVLAGLLILLGAAGGALVFMTMGSTVEAVAARVPVARGEVMTPEMFTTVEIAPNQQLSYIGADELPGLLGKRAAHDVAAGSLVGPEAGVEAMVPATGRTVVGLSLPPGAEPAIPLSVGDRVRVILTEPAYACAAGEVSSLDSETGAVVVCSVDVVIPAVVVATARDEASGQVTVSVDVAETDAPRTAAAAACPWSLCPQATTVPLDLRARLWLLPAAIAVTPDKPAGTPNASPQARTVPSPLSARACRAPTAIAPTAVPSRRRPFAWTCAPWWRFAPAPPSRSRSDFRASNSLTFDSARRSMATKITESVKTTSSRTTPTPSVSPI